MPINYCRDLRNSDLNNPPKYVWRPGSVRTRWGSLQRSLRPPSWILGRGAGKGEEGKGREEGKGQGGKEGREKEKEGGGTGTPPIKKLVTGLTELYKRADHLHLKDSAATCIPVVHL